MSYAFIFSKAQAFFSISQAGRWIHIDRSVGGHEPGDKCLGGFRGQLLPASFTNGSDTEQENRSE